MGNKKLQHDAFEFYFSLGPGRSYRTVADRYEVSKTAVANLAEREDWQQRILDLERKAHEATEKRIAETLEEMGERHIKMIKVVQRKALETLKSMPLNTAIEAVRALDLSIKHERLVRGEPTDRAALDVENLIKREYERWLISEDSEGEEAGDGDGDDGEAS
ncbi:MAG: hypothetical protein KJ831_16555 [Candidatus Eisenbacteria bacterium]|nr:hypothetical protein [Planctomycetota bacterium]MBU1701754.1 hypothetical protein [Candidatus Eisenbacteria bacterium]